MMRRHSSVILLLARIHGAKIVCQPRPVRYVGTVVIAHFRSGTVQKFALYAHTLWEKWCNTTPNTNQKSDKKHDRLIDFKGMSTHPELILAEWSKNHIHCTLIFWLFFFFVVS